MGKRETEEEEMTGRANGGEKGQPREEEEKRDGEDETEFDSNIVVFFVIILCSK